ncbi:Ras guanine nucleotide exchange factor bud5 [Tilletia horrida]|nr:Ras guanine nucleotide exchange factor bud5 [Tilletia horrida]
MAVSPVGSQSSSALAFYTGPEEYVVALHDFTSQNDTCLSFQSGQVIKVFNRDSSGWWDGELDGHRGWFPSNYVDQDGLLSTDGRGSRASGDLIGGSNGAGGRASSLNGGPYPQNGNTIGLRTSGMYEDPEAGYAAGGPQASSASSTSTIGNNTPQPPIPTRSSSSTHHRKRSGNSTTGKSSTYSPYETILEPILHAIALLHNAVRANRVAHFQPSTACVISSVRSVLSATDCLTRDSAVLRAHPVLAIERKQILSELTRLVQQSKRASAMMVDESKRGQEMDVMLDLAELTLVHVRRFLEVADECGVPIPDRRGSLYEETYEDRRGGMPVVSHATNGNMLSVDDGRSIDNRSSAYYTTFTSDQFSPRSSRSFADLRSTHSRSVYVNSHGDDGGMLGVSYVPRSEHRNTMRTTFTTATTSAQYHGHGNLSSSPPESLTHDQTGAPRISEERKRAGKGYEPEDAANDDDEAGQAQDQDDDDEPSDKHTPAEVLERLSTANDELLSVIAAFIGHVHTHTRQSHASSFAHLIDMTREAVDAVRNLLTVVESVNNHPDLQADRPKEVAILWETRESLYEATTALVTAARLVTASGNAPPQASSTSSGGNATPPNTEEDEKSRLLSAATGVLRTGGECVGAVRLCLGQAHAGMLISVPEATRPRSQMMGQHGGSSASAYSRGQEVDDDDEDDDLVPDEDGNYGVSVNGGTVRRGKHTLSFLGRKATSLSCLREKYERDGFQTAFDGIVETDVDGEEDGEGAADQMGGAAGSPVRSNWISKPRPSVESELKRDSGSSRSDRGDARGSRGSGRQKLANLAAAAAAAGDKDLVESPTQMQDSSPDSDFGVVTSSGRFDGPGPVAAARISGEAVRRSGSGRVSTGASVRASTTLAANAVAEAERQLTRLVLPNGNAGKTKPRRNSNGTNSDGDGSRVSNNSASSTSVGSLTGSTSLTRSVRSGSETTAETSARPSLERMDSEMSSPVLDTYPHTAPLLGKFPREMPPSQLSSSAASTIDDGSSDTTQPHTNTIPQSASDSQIEGAALALAAGRRGSNSNEPIYMQPDYDPEDVVFNKEGRLTGATLAALVEKMTPHDTTVEAGFSTAFYMCFRLFTTPVELFQTLVARYNLQLPPGIELSDADRTLWLERKVTPVRLRVFNFLKLWLESHYNEATDAVILPQLIEFARTSMATPVMSRHGQRIVELAQRRLSASGIRNGNRGPSALQRAYSTDMLRPNAAALAARMYQPSAFPRQGVFPPNPIVKDKWMNPLRSGDWKSVNIMEIDPTELARQITIMGSKLYCSIQPEELLNLDSGSKKAAAGGAGTAGATAGQQSFVKSMSALSTAISGWINETILGEPNLRNRVQLMKFFIKLGDRLFGLQNFDALFAIHAALGSAQIDRLRQTWDSLSSKYRMLMDQQKQAVTFARNWASYRTRLRNTVPPALPFLGVFLTDLTFINDGNARMRPSPHAPDRKLLNFDRYVRISNVVTELQRFQVPYTLQEVPELQLLLKSVLANLPSSNGTDPANDLWLRSRALEPRQGEGTLTGRNRDGGGKGLDIFNWK